VLLDAAGLLTTQSLPATLRLLQSVLIPLLTTPGFPPAPTGRRGDPRCACGRPARGADLPTGTVR